MASSSGQGSICSAARAVLLLIIAAGFEVSAVDMDEDTAELAKMLRENCGAETSVDMALVEAVNKGAPLSPDPNLKCYMKCVMETAGMMSEGDVDVDAVLALLPDDFRARNEPTFRSCGTKKGADDCDTAYLTQQCWQIGNPKEYFLI